MSNSDRTTSSRTTRLFLLTEGAAFGVAALIHSGLLIDGHKHLRAAIAETVIGTALFVGFALAWVFPRFARAIGLTVQAFALLGTSVGIFMVVIGVGPQTVLDIVYHVAIAAALISGLVLTKRRSAGTGCT